MRILLLLCLLLYAWDSYHSCNSLCKRPNINLAIYKLKLVRSLSNKPSLPDFDFILSNYITISSLVCGMILFLWNLLIYVRYNFTFTHFNHDLSLGPRWNYGFEQAKNFADLVLNLHAVIIFLFVLEFPISLTCTCYLFHFNFEVPITKLNHYKFDSKMFKISTCFLSLIIFQVATGKPSQFLCLFVLQIGCSVFDGNKSVVWFLFSWSYYQMISR